MLKRMTCLCALILFAAPSLGATYVLQADGSVNELGEPEAPISAESHPPGMMCENGVCRPVPVPGVPATPPSIGGTTTHYHISSAPRFPRLARMFGRGRVVTMTECAPASFAPVPQETAKPMPVGPAPTRLVRIGNHFVDADVADRLKAAGFSWADIIRLVLKYGPSIIEDILQLIGK